MGYILRIKSRPANRKTPGAWGIKPPCPLCGNPSEWTHSDNGSTSNVSDYHCAGCGCVFEFIEITQNGAAHYCYDPKFLDWEKRISELEAR